jgi:hypothetical protein
VFEECLTYRDSAVNRKRREAPHPLPYGRRYGACVLVSGGGEYLEAQSPLQLALAVYEHNREQRNCDPGDLDYNRRLASQLLTGLGAWSACAVGTDYFTPSMESKYVH